MTENLETLQTLEGWYTLHDFRNFDWPTWNSVSENEKLALLEDFMHWLNTCENHNLKQTGAFGCYEILGHKADFCFLNLREDTHQISQTEQAFNRTQISSFFVSNYSYVSVTELSNYVNQADGELSEQAKNMIQARLKPKLPESAHLCFYPMNKKRGETENWYSQEITERRRMMKEHGLVGRKYAGKIIQMIGGSIGFDDWEWGVTLFADDPLSFKHIITEMRFDEVSTRFAEFGPFYLGNKLNKDDFVKRLLAKS